MNPLAVGARHRTPLNPLHCPHHFLSILSKDALEPECLPFPVLIYIH
jgi:hypothetical protein